MRFRNKKRLKESHDALEDAKAQKDRVQSRAEEVHEVVAFSREIRRRNHFAEQIRDIMSAQKG